MTPDYIDEISRKHYQPGMSLADFKTAMRRTVADSLASAARMVSQQGQMLEPSSFERRLLMSLSKAITARSRPFLKTSTVHLDPRAAEEIRKLRKMGVSVKEIASQFEVSTGAVYDILSGASWASKK